MHKTAALLTSLLIGAAAPVAVPLAAGAAPQHRAVAAAVDTDGDGHAADDCAPLDPTVHPGAVDRPDLDFTDTNCDGIDGDATHAIFVSVVGGNDLGTGTRDNPLQSITAGVTKAATDGKDVYVAGGTYAGSVQLADRVGIYGAYTPGTWARSASETTTVQGGPAAVAVGDTGVILQLLTLRGQPDGAGNSYGLRIANNGPTASQVLLEDVTAQGLDAANGSSGGTGLTGVTGLGLGGGQGGTGGCGAGVPGNLGGLGGNGGAPGATGASGPNGSWSSFDTDTWQRPFAVSGNSGGAGGGGRGGQGGTGDVNVFTAVCGGTGGTGGAGGSGGGGGQGGQAGGGSFGAYVFRSSLVALGSSLASGAGGAGGQGGSGGFGGGGAGGSNGLPGQCISIFVTVCAGNGFAGAPGAAGGRGGGGGGGVGGTSAAVYQAGAGSGYTADAGTTTNPGAAGPGGFQGNLGPRAADGHSAPVLRTAIAPETSTFDFDGDGVADPADSCPADAGAGGCPTGPDTTVTSGPADGSFVLADRATFGLGSTAESPSFTCSLDDAVGTECATPESLTHLSSRTHLLRVWSRGADLPDASAATRSFTVPVNDTALTASKGWTRKSGSGYFLNSYSITTSKGASLSRKATGIQQVALVATTGPGLGKVKVMWGSTLLKKVSLVASKTHKKQLLPVATFAAPRSGTVKVIVLTSGKQVRIEGLGLAAG